MPRSHEYHHLDVPEVTPQAVLVTAIAGFTIVYSLIHSIAGLPSFFELIFVCIPGWIFGQAARERLQMMFGYATVGLGTSQGIVERVRMRASSLLGVPGGQKGLGYVGGLWNMGNTCYQNSVLQAMASLNHLQPHLNALADDERTDEGPYHSFALGDLIHSLNTITTSPRSITAPALITAPGSSAWRYNEQQDAQEFFQRLTSALEKEVTQYWKELQDIPGLEAIKAGETGVELKKDEVSKKILPPELRNPFEGLAAQRVGCVQCGYMEAIRLQTFTTLSLPLPSTMQCTLEDCLAEYCTMEYLDGVECDKCSLLKRAEKLRMLLNPPPDAKPLSEQLVKTVTERLQEVETALEEDDFSDATMKNLKVGAKVSSTKTKQYMIARSPPVLALHMNRSRYNPITGMSSKNYATVSYPSVLDISDFTTRHDALDTTPDKPISARLPQTEKTKEGSNGNIYELKSVIAHFGGHHNGHYISYRKSKGLWYRISDDEVYAFNEHEVTNIGNAFMLFYEQNDSAVPQVEPLSEKAEGTEGETGDEAADSTVEYDSDTGSASDPGLDIETTLSSTDPSPSSAAPSASSTGYTPETPPSTPPSSVIASGSEGDTPSPKSENAPRKREESPTHLPSPPLTDIDGPDILSRSPSEGL